VTQSRFSIAAAGSLALALILFGLNLVISVVNARLLGTYGFGIFATALSLLGLLSIPSVLGFDRVVARNVATHDARREVERARGILRATSRFVLMSSTLCAAAAIGLVLVRPQTFADPTALSVALVALPLLALGRLRQAALLGLGRVFVAQLPETIVRPSIYLVALTLVLLMGLTVSPTATLAIHVASVAVAFVVGTVLLSSATRRVWGAGTSVRPEAGWWKQAVPLTLVSGSGLLIANLPVLALSVLAGPADAGLFAVAHRAASVQVLGLTTINTTTVGPMIARLTATSQRASLQHLLTRSARFAFLVTLITAGAMILFRDLLLGFFGSEFRGAAISLVILSGGQLVNAACGSVGTLFVMSNETRYAVAGFVVGATTTFILLILLVPPWGVIGASVATAAGVATWNIGMVQLAWSRKRIDPTIVGRSWRTHP
jgi:O-antigen/teichoic acid export membrane protein